MRQLASNQGKDKIRTISHTLPRCGDIQDGNEAFNLQYGLPQTPTLLIVAHIMGYCDIHLQLYDIECTCTRLCTEGSVI
jgi:hypothetical protein